MATKKTKKHSLWSKIFLLATLVCFLLLVGVYLIVGYSLSAALLGSVLTVVTLFLLEHEKKKKELEKGKWLWSIFFAAITVGVALYIVQTAFTVVALVATGTSLIALFLLIREKYKL